MTIEVPLAKVWANMTPELIGFPPDFGKIVLSGYTSSDTKKILAEKILDYQSIDAIECWLVNSEEQTIEVMSLAGSKTRTLKTYSMGDIVESLVFKDMLLPVAEVFQD